MRMAASRQERYFAGMRPEFLSLSDHALAERMHRWEARSPDDDAAFEKFRHDRAILSREAWESLTNELGCDSGPLAEVGVWSSRWTRVLPNACCRRCLPARV